MTTHLTLPAKCRICGHEWIGVISLPTSPDGEYDVPDLECPRCGNAAGEQTEPEEEIPF